jgi:D-threo-aldose 1-dehydrogenase
MYGLGAAEKELGELARAHPSDIVVATKFGIEPTLMARGMAHVQGPVRGLLARVPALQHRAKSAAAGPRSGPAGRFLYRSRGYDAAAARSSLWASLGRLGTGQIDLFLLHDPPADAVPSDELGACLEDARASGMIRAWGVAGPTDDAIEVGSSLGARCVLQIPFDASGRARSSVAGSWAAGVITYGVLGAAMSRIMAYVSSRGRRGWNDAVGFDLSDPEMTADMLLRVALSDDDSGVVLYSTTRVDRIDKAARLVDDEEGRSPEKLAPFRALLAELGAGRVPPG